MGASAAPRGASLRGTDVAKLCSSTAARLSRLGGWLRIAISHVPSISPQNFRRESPRWRGSVQLGGLLARGAVRGAVGAMSVARPTYIRGGSINSRTSFLVRRRPVGPS